MGGNDGLDHIRTKTTELLVHTAILKGEWCVATYYAAVIKGDSISQDGNCGCHRWIVANVNESGEVASHTGIRATIHE